MSRNLESKKYNSKTSSKTLAAVLTGKIFTVNGNYSRINKAHKGELIALKRPKDERFNIVTETELEKSIREQIKHQNLELNAINLDYVFVTRKY